MKLFKTRAIALHYIGATLSLLLLSQLVHAASADAFSSLETTWSEPAAQLTLRGAGPDTIHNGSLVRYGLEARVTAYCYLIRLDARGDAWLWRGDACAPGSDPVGQRTLIPTASALELQSAVGEETILAFLMPEPVTFAFEPAESAWMVLADDSLQSLVDLFALAAGSGQLAVSRLVYTVEDDAGELQFTTRAILDQVANAASSGQENGVLTTFNVDAIRFEFGSAQPTPAGIRQMNAFGEALRDPMLADKRIIIAGHTDDIGDNTFNMALSRSRSEAVKQYFSRNFGVAASRMETRAFGESRPIMPNDTDSNRARNRRVEITFLY